MRDLCWRCRSRTRQSQTEVLRLQRHLLRRKGQAIWLHSPAVCRCARTHSDGRKTLQSPLGAGIYSRRLARRNLEGVPLGKLAARSPSVHSNLLLSNCRSRLWELSSKPMTSFRRSACLSIALVLGFADLGFLIVQHLINRARIAADTPPLIELSTGVVVVSYVILLTAYWLVAREMRTRRRQTTSDPHRGHLFGSSVGWRNVAVSGADSKGESCGQSVPSSSSGDRASSVHY